MAMDFTHVSSSLALHSLNHRHFQSKLVQHELLVLETFFSWRWPVLFSLRAVLPETFCQKKRSYSKITEKRTFYPKITEKRTFWPKKTEKERNSGAQNSFFGTSSGNTASSALTGAKIWKIGLVNCVQILRLLREFKNWKQKQTNSNDKIVKYWKEVNASQKLIWSVWYPPNTFECSEELFIL